jgi:hypothetical protein
MTNLSLGVTTKNVTPEIYETHSTSDTIPPKHYGNFWSISCLEYSLYFIHGLETIMI